MRLFIEGPRRGLVDWIAAYMEEDLGNGDATSEAIFPATATGRAQIVARERFFVAGVAAIGDVFARFDCVVALHVNDGSWVESGAVILTVSGPTRGLLAAERLALNMLGRMSGVATKTRELVEALGEACAGAVVAGTRKTTPGFRQFEKEAILIAGGHPHRYDLGEEAMIKDNHREAAGDVSKAVQLVRAAHPKIVISTEVETLEDAMAAATAGTNWLLIDNQEPKVGAAWADEIWQKFPQIKIEASGGITPANILEFGWADRISLGWLTHHAVSVDVGLDWQTEAQ